MYRSVQAGVPRTGSTLVWQIANTLIGPTLKVHKFVKTEIPLLVTYRDPRDSFVSDWRCKVNAQEGQLMTESAALSYAKRYKGLFRKINNRFKEFYNEKNNICWLKYEDFVNNHEYIYSRLEAVFDLEISEEQRTQLSDEFSLEANKKISELYSDFKQYAQESKIHGNHIYSAKQGTWRKFLSNETQKLVTKSLQDVLKQWGYAE